MKNEHPKNLYPVNTEIYYTGDMANQPGKGFVRNFREDATGRSMDIVIEGAWRQAPADDNGDFLTVRGEDREFLGITMAHFSSGPGRRFWTLKEWDEDQTAKLEAMQKEIQDNPIISASLSKELGDIKF